MSFKARTGIFFLIVGGSALILFFASLGGADPEDRTIVALIGFIATPLGFFLWWKGRPRPTPTERGRLFHRLLGGKKKGD